MPNKTLRSPASLPMVEPFSFETSVPLGGLRMRRLAAPARADYIIDVNPLVGIGCGVSPHRDA